LLITSELTNQSARKALFTCVVYTKYGYMADDKEMTRYLLFRLQHSERVAMMVITVCGRAP